MNFTLQKEQCTKSAPKAASVRLCDDRFGCLPAPPDEGIAAQGATAIGPTTANIVHIRALLVSTLVHPSVLLY